MKVRLYHYFLVLAGMVSIPVYLGFWLEVLIALGVGLILGAFLGYYDDRNRRTMRNIGKSGFTPRNSAKGKDDRIRDAVEKEWDRKSTFDRPEDLR